MTHHKSNPKSGDSRLAGRTSFTRRNFLQIAAAGAAAGVGGAIVYRQPSALAQKGKKKPTRDPLTISCVESGQHQIRIRVCAGASGAQAGFSVQWMPLPEGTNCADFVWPTGDGEVNICKASFSGTPKCSLYNLGPSDGCGNNGADEVVVKIGNLNDDECGVGLSNCGADELDCGTTYVFRAFAHGNSDADRSPYTANLCCSTLDCESCVRTQGFWKTHGPDECHKGNNTNEWPKDAMGNTLGLTLGGTQYAAEDLCTNLNLPGQGNAVRILSHQLIAALFNIASGAEPPEDCDIDAASALLTDLNINTDSVEPKSTLGQQMIAAADCLDRYNNGFGGVDHCK